jgi:hypothetical protein
VRLGATMITAYDGGRGMFANVGTNVEARTGIR